MSRTRQFYIPNVSMWNWSLVSPSFVKLQLERAQLSYRETDDALNNLETEIQNINKEIRAKWATASATTMRAFEARYKEVRAENKRISYVRLKLREVIDRMKNHLEVMP